MNHYLAQSLSTIKDFIFWGKNYLEINNIYYGPGYNNAYAEIKDLIFYVLNFPLNVLLSPELLDIKLLVEEKYRLINLVKRRIIYRIPIAYLIKQAIFANKIFYVDPRVIIPRSSYGELIVKKFFNIFNTPNRLKSILELGTGSGCIAICSAFYFYNSKIDAVDISSKALEVADINIRSNNLQKRIFPIYSDLFDRLPLHFYDLIITNPPYLNLVDIRDLPQEYLYEPNIAVYGGYKYGLNIIKLILHKAYHYLTEKGILICEAGHHFYRLKKEFPNTIFNEFNLTNKKAGIFYLTREQLLKLTQ